MTECPIMSSSDEEIILEVNETDKEHLKELMYELIDEYLDHDILIYKYPKFIDKIYSAIRPIVEMLYAPIETGINNCNLYDLFLEVSIIYFTMTGNQRYYMKRPGTIDKEYAKKQLARINNTICSLH